MTSAPFPATSEQQWQPIETAPVETMVLTVWDGVSRVSGNPVRNWCVAALDADSGDWYNDDGDYIDTPTHWMPLPEPPK